MKSKKHHLLAFKGADIADVASVFLASRLKSSHIFTVDRTDFDYTLVLVLTLIL